MDAFLAILQLFCVVLSSIAYYDRPRSGLLLNAIDACIGFINTRDRQRLLPILGVNYM